MAGGQTLTNGSAVSTSATGLSSAVVEGHSLHVPTSAGRLGSADRRPIRCDLQPGRSATTFDGVGSASTEATGRWRVRVACIRRSRANHASRCDDRVGSQDKPGHDGWDWATHVIRHPAGIAPFTQAAAPRPRSTRAGPRGPPPAARDRRQTQAPAVPVRLRAAASAPDRGWPCAALRRASGRGAPP